MTRRIPALGALAALLGWACSGEEDAAFEGGSSNCEQRQPWAEEMVSEAAQPGSRVSVAIGPEDVLHFAFADPQGAGVRHATTSSTGATTASELAAPIDLGPCHGRCFSLAVDADGKAHLALHDYGLKKLRYATDASGQWEVELAASQGARASPSLAVDAQGRAHIAAYAPIKDTLFYVTNTTVQWSHHPIDLGGSYCSLALDAEGHAHVAYVGEAGDLKYATNQGAVWESAVVLAGAASRSVPSIAVDAAGRVHVVAALRPDEPGQEAGIDGVALTYATRAGGAWTTTSVAPLDADTGQSLRLDGSGALHLAYGDGPGAYLLARAADAWAPGYAPIGASVHSDETLAVSSDGSLHLCFVREGTGLSCATAACNP